ncbi:hypothetical protein [Nonomuraea sp. NPDC049625]|uniref:hypothetical protein n=1 Tax=Nonomuraea sp. NPDC049625 TaxID=3155775 RepID=UPI00341C0B9F
MAIPKKGSPLITVDGTVIRWRVRHKPTYGRRGPGAAHAQRGRGPAAGAAADRYFEEAAAGRKEKRPPQFRD